MDLPSRLERITIIRNRIVAYQGGPIEEQIVLLDELVDDLKENGISETTLVRARARYEALNGKFSQGTAWYDLGLHLSRVEKEK